MLREEERTHLAQTVERIGIVDPNAVIAGSNPHFVIDKLIRHFGQNQRTKGDETRIIKPQETKQCPCLECP
jgi:hypothetical protein